MDTIFPGQGKPRPGRGGIWTTVSADDGRSWSKWIKVTFKGVPGGGGGDLTQDSFLDGNTIYATFPTTAYYGHTYYRRSADEGKTWTEQFCMTPHPGYCVVD